MRSTGMRDERALTRRDFARAAGASLLLTACARIDAARPGPQARLKAIERSTGGRLGAYILDTGSGKSIGWRADERFCHCSTFKLSLAALALREHDAGRLDLAERLSFGRSDIAGYSPVIEANLAAGSMAIVDLAQAIQITSDNAAANVLMRRLGGPGAVTRFWREIGDSVSRLDGYEPDINVIPPGTEENSTTPRAMAETVRRIVLGTVLKPDSRNLLQGWMEATRSGMNRIRADIPAGWRGLDKTGTGMRPVIGNKTNDLAVLFPPGGRAPLIAVGYVDRTEFSADVRKEDEAALMELGKVAVSWADRRDHA